MRRIDAESTEFFFSLLQQHGYRVSVDHSKLLSLIPSYDFFAYRPQSRVLPATRAGQIHASDLWHEGVHLAISLKYGARLPNRPRIHLLNECLGLGLSVYIATLMISRFGAPQSGELLSTYQRNSKLLGVPMRPLINAGLKRPFSLYRRIVRESYAICERLLTRAEESKAGIRLDAPMLVRDIRRFRTAVFFRHFDMTIPPFYVLALCGPHSDAQDRRAVKECCEHLDQSDDLPGFIARLGLKNAKI